MLTTLRSLRNKIPLLRVPYLLARSRQVFLGFCCLLLVVVFHPQPNVAQSSGVTQATVTEVLDGNQVFIQNRQASVNDTARRGQRVRTQNSRVELRFNNGAVGRLGKNSVLTVGDRCSQLRQGQILVNGAMNGCSSSVVAGVRGTIYMIEVNEANQTEIKVLEGVVNVTQEQVMIPEEESDVQAPGSSQSVAPLPPDLNSLPGQSPNTGINNSSFSRLKEVKQLGLPIPSQPSGNGAITQPPPAAPSPSPSPSPVPTGSTGTGSQEKTVNAGEKLAVGPDQGPIGPVEKISQDEFSMILSGNLFTGFTIPLPGVSELQQSFQNLFPGIPFPVNLPGLNLPGIPTPSIPGIPGLPFF